MNDDSEIELVSNSHGFVSDPTLGNGLRPGTKPTAPYGHANSYTSDEHPRASYGDAGPANTHA